MSGVAIGTQMGPDYRIELDDIDITENFRSRLISLKITDKGGQEMDELSIVLEDSDAQISFPPRGSLVKIAIGWQGEALFYKGEFTISGVLYTGAPDLLTLTGFSTDLSSTLTEIRSESYDQITLGEIVQRIAARNQLGVSLTDDLAATFIGHFDQTRENDLQFITRLAERFGMVAIFKAGKLMLIVPGSGTTAGGKTLPEVTIQRQEGDQYSFAYSAETLCVGVKARWIRLDKGSQGSVTLNGTINPPGDVFAARGSRYLVLSDPFKTEQEAREAALAAWKKSVRSNITLKFQLAMGRAELIPQMPVRVSGFTPLADRYPWIISQVEHSITSGQGLTSSLSLHMNLPTTINMLTEPE